MKETIRRLLKNILTEDDNLTYCVAKVMALIAFVSFIGYAVVGLFHDHFSLAEFGNGLMTVLLGSGGVILGKQVSQK